MKLVIDLLDFECGRSYGYQEYLLNLLDDFHSHRSDILASQVILLVKNSELIFFSERYNDVFEYLPYECGGYLNTLFTRSKAIHKMRLSSNDVLLFTGNTMPLFHSQAKTILVIHDLLYLYRSLFSKSVYYFIFRLQRRLFVPYSIYKANKIIAISQFTRDEIIKAYSTSSSKISVIYNYFNFEKYNDDITHKSTINKKYILSICAKYKHKNHITILKAFEQFYAKHKNFCLVIIGSLSPEAIDYISKLGKDIKHNIIVCQHLNNSDIKKMYENASVYVSASLYEGLGMPVVEALYFGLPTLLSDIPIHHEVSLENAQFFTPMSSLELSKLMELSVVKNKSHNREFIHKLKEMYSTENTSLRYIREINLFHKV